MPLKSLCHLLARLTLTPTITTAPPFHSAARRVRYLSRVLDASFNVLFDGRRRTAHTLVYNYFMVRWWWRRPGEQQS